MGTAQEEQNRYQFERRPKYVMTIRKKGIFVSAPAVFVCVYGVCVLTSRKMFLFTHSGDDEGWLIGRLYIY